MTKVYVTAQDLVDLGILTSAGTAGRAVARGDLPRPIKIGQRHLWKWAEVESHIDLMLEPVR